MLLGYANTFERNNAVSVFLMGALPAVAGSAISFMLAAFAAWGAISLARGRFPFRLTELDRLLAWTFTVFAMLVFATGLFAENGLQVFRATIWLLPFLSLWLVIPRLRASPDLDYVQLYIRGAVAGCIGALVLAGVQLLVFGARAEGGAGNAAVFAIMCLCLAGIAGLDIGASRRSHRLLAGIAVLAGLTAVILSQTRGVALAILPVLAVVLVHAAGRWREIFLRPAGPALFASAGLVLFTAWDAIGHRIDRTVWEVGRLLNGGHTNSMGERLRLWEAAWAAFRDSPLSGYGIQNRMEALVPYLVGDGLPIRGFSHPHNAYLASVLDGGVIVLAALLALLAMPVLVAWRAPEDGSRRRRLYLAAVVTATYASIGLTQIMFKHDIMDSFYIFTAILVAASIPDARGASGGRRRT